MWGAVEIGSHSIVQTVMELSVPVAQDDFEPMTILLPQLPRYEPQGLAYFSYGEFEIIDSTGV